AVAAVAAIGLADDLWSGAERGFRAHLGRGRTTGVLKLLGIPLVGLVATRRLSGALLVGLAANFVNQLDTRPGRALKAYLVASPGRLLKARGLKVQVQKFDPYINVDPGTMSPFQHGEVFVTEDGAETDLDIGHYERFIDENLSRNSNHTAGSIWERVIRKERR